MAPNTDEFQIPGFDAQVEEGDPILAVVVHDGVRLVVDQTSGEQVQLLDMAIRPVAFTLKHPSNALHGSMRVSLRANAKYMRIVGDYRKAIGGKCAAEDARLTPRPELTGQIRRFGTGQFLGFVGYFIMRSYQYGGDIDSSRPFPVLVAKAKPEDLATARGIDTTYDPESRWVRGDGSTAERPASVAQQAAVTEATGADWVEEYGEQAIRFLDGTTAAEALADIVARERAMGVPDGIEPAMRDGSGPRLLVSLGLLTRDDDGVYHKVPEQVPA